MTSTATTYLVETKYLVDDKAQRALGGIGSAASSASRTTSALKQHLLGLGAAVIGGGGLLAAKRVFLDFNSSIEQSLISLSTTMLGFGAVSTFEQGMARSTKLLAEYQQVARVSVGETKDFVAMHQSIAGPLMAAGMTMTEIKKVAIGATVASQIMGEQAEMTALDIKQMSMGTMTARDRVGGMLVGMLGAQKGMKKFGYAEWNKLSQQKRNEMLMEAVQNPALAKGAAAMGTSFAGVLSTLKDNITMTLGKAGLPVFKAITAEIQSWSAWIESHQVEVANMVSALSSNLKTAFGFVRDVFGFIVDHKELLLSIAKGFLAFKAVKMGTGLVTGGISGVAQMISNTAATFGKAGEASGTLASRMASAANIISLFSAAGSAAIIAFEAWGEHRITRDQNKTTQYGGVVADVAKLASREHRQYGTGRFGEGKEGYLAAAASTLASAREAGLIDKTGKILDDRIYQAVDSSGLYGPRAREANEEMRRVLVDALEAERSGAIATFKIMQNAASVASQDMRMAAAAFGPTLSSAFAAGGIFDPLMRPAEDRSNAKQAISVNISKVEVPAKDPDRWIIDLGRFAAKQVRAPRQARVALRR